MRIIAIEGASFAGKTTTIAALKAQPATSEAHTFCC
ncbi:uridine kinase [Phytomonospora endophytica]|uniref:Uridine kinase n=1 Tax=Phytomonospora endophytica TaxID=714109 RepID=A0A841FTT8_9ACTN|nr:uridine kinase [Phytomonospora endophytica]